MKAVEAVRDAGGEVALVFTMVDREEGADEAFKDAGLPFRSLFRAAEFLKRCSVLVERAFGREPDGAARHDDKRASICSRLRAPARTASDRSVTRRCPRASDATICCGEHARRRRRSAHSTRGSVTNSRGPSRARQHQRASRRHCLEDRQAERLEPRRADIGVERAIVRRDILLRAGKDDARIAAAPDARSSRGPVRRRR